MTCAVGVVDGGCETRAASDLGVDMSSATQTRYSRDLHQMLTLHELHAGCDMG